MARLVEWGRSQKRIEGGIFRNPKNPFSIFSEDLKRELKVMWYNKPPIAPPPSSPEDLKRELKALQWRSHRHPTPLYYRRSQKRIEGISHLGHLALSQNNEDLKRELKGLSLPVLVKTFLHMKISKEN